MLAPDNHYPMAAAILHRSAPMSGDRAAFPVAQKHRSQTTTAENGREHRPSATRFHLSAARKAPRHNGRSCSDLAENGGAAVLRQRDTHRGHYRPSQRLCRIASRSRPSQDQLAASSVSTSRRSSSSLRLRRVSRVALAKATIRPRSSVSASGSSQDCTSTQRQSGERVEVP